MSKKKAALIILAVIILVGAIAAHFYQPAAAKLSPTKYTIPARNDYSFGTSSPRLTIVEFSDFACPFCQESYPALRELGLKYKNSVQIIFKDFPIHADSLYLALAARCAGEQGLFWPMHDKLFAMQGQFATTSLPDLAVSVGADKTKFSACLTGQKYLTDIRADYADGQTLDSNGNPLVSGTPTFFFNGYKAVGEIPKDKFEEIIRQFLK
ncbi:MAG TPA: thioredoxin domain-containing protein [Candidatus Methylomirabilis sp.]|nr:thioredoxin domain-containing protein [Candidatus Methylomirabilis sp.]